jgi:hypothetical protein
MGDGVLIVNVGGNPSIGKEGGGGASFCPLLALALCSKPLLRFFLVLTDS